MSARSETDSAPTAKKAAPEHAWRNGTFRVGDATVVFKPYRSLKKVTGTFSKFPIGTKASVGDASMAITEPDDHFLDAAIEGQFGNLAVVMGHVHTELARTERAVPLSLSFTIELPGFEKIEDHAHLGNLDAVRLGNLLSGVQRSPLPFEKEPPTDDKPVVALLRRYPKVGSQKQYDRQDWSVDLVGAAKPKKVWDFDFVAVDQRTKFAKASKRACSYDKGTVEIPVLESEVTVYERRSGKRVAQRRFTPSNDCPSSVTLVNGSHTETIDVGDYDITDWLRAELKLDPKPRPKP